ncbi:hypothetical protein JMJ56_02600 [Belnapia sp. T18]|uniref:Tryptophan-rich sensory protein n=1 Tax=Belnapia arida TaxID=2804533 RepID=A0ABS1TWQ7_9PROT|nr:hypothetical protein [Belnapia arida]MBL6076878.1 hypothetical protein [Belnapia arida]
MPRILALLNLLLPALLPFAGGLARLIGTGHPLWAMQSIRTPVVPAPYAFSIWGPIFALALAWGFWQMLPAQRADPRLARLRGPAAGAFALMLLWMVVAQLTPNGWHLLAIILALLAAALMAFFRSIALPAEGAGWRWIARPLFGLLAGWVSAASIVNLSGAAATEGVTWGGTDPALVAMGLVLLAAWIGSAVLRRSRGDLWYAGALLWALFAVAVANVTLPAVAITAGLGMAMVAVAAWLGRARPRRAQEAGAGGM